MFRLDGGKKKKSLFENEKRVLILLLPNGITLHDFI